MTDCTNFFQGIRFLVGVGSYQNAAAVTPSNDTDLSETASALYIGVTGDVTVDMEGVGEGILFKTVPVGYLYGRFTRVYATGTDATDIISLW